MNGSDFVRLVQEKLNWPFLFSWLNWSDDRKTNGDLIRDKIQHEIQTLESRAKMMKGEYSSVYGNSIKKEEFTFCKFNDKIGQGGSAVVYKALWVHRNENVALKIFKFEILRGMATILDTIVCEAKKMKDLRKCAHVIRCHGIMMGENRVGIVLDLADMDLASLIDKWSNSVEKWSERTWKEIVGRASDAANGFNFLHALGIVHLDVKTQNLLVCGVHTKIGDLGHSKVQESIRSHHSSMSSATDSASTKGTWQFSPPEMFKRHGGPSRKAPSVDVYGFGCVLFHLCTRIMPFAGWCPQEQLQVFFEKSSNFEDELELDKIVRGSPGCPTVLVDLCKLCCKFNVTERCDFEKIVQDLDNTLRGMQKQDKIWAFCSQKPQDFIDVHKESQTLMMSFEIEKSGFDFKVFPQTSFNDFCAALKTANEKNVVSLLFSGHGDLRHGFIFSQTRSSTQLVDRTQIAAAFEEHCSGFSTIECVVLNACRTHVLAKSILQSGIKYVVCWKDSVDDQKAREFAVQFYTALAKTYPRDIQHAFDLAKQAIQGKGTVLLLSASQPCSVHSRDAEDNVSYIGPGSNLQDVEQMKFHAISDNRRSPDKGNLSEVLVRDDYNQDCAVVSILQQRIHQITAHRAQPSMKMRESSQNNVNCILNSRETVAIFLMGDVMEFGPAGIKFDPPVKMLLPLFTGILARLKCVGITHSTGVFRWQEAESRWKQICDLENGVSYMDCDRVCIESSIFSSEFYVIALFSAVINSEQGSLQSDDSPNASDLRKVAFCASCPSYVTIGSDFVVNVCTLPLIIRNNGACTSGYQNSIWDIACGCSVAENSLLKIRLDTSELPGAFTFKDGQQEKLLMWSSVMAYVNFELTCLYSVDPSQVHFIKFLIEYHVESEESYGSDQIWLQLNVSNSAPDENNFHLFKQQSVSVGTCWPLLPTILPIFTRQNIKSDEDCELESLQKFFSFGKSYKLQETLNKPLIKELESRVLSNPPQVVHFTRFATVGSTRSAGIQWFDNESASVLLTGENLYFLAGQIWDRASRVECVFLNVGSTYGLAGKLVEIGIPYVICWRSEARDEACLKLSELFYSFLSTNTRRYGFAFEHAVEVMASRGFEWDTANGGYGGPCLVWNDSDLGRAIIDREWVSSSAGRGLTRGEICCSPSSNTEDLDSGDGYHPGYRGAERTCRDVLSSASSPLASESGADCWTEDFAAQAGQQEKCALQHFGFKLIMPSEREACVGYGLDNEGYLLPNALHHLFGVDRYDELWGSRGCVVARLERARRGGFVLTKESVHAGLIAMREAKAIRELAVQRSRNWRNAVSTTCAPAGGASQRYVGKRQLLRALCREASHEQILRVLVEAIEKVSVLWSNWQ